MKYKELNMCEAIENKGDVLACKFYHPIFPEGQNCICNKGVQKVDKKEWEIFWIQHETRNAFYGNLAEGPGLINCMILKKDTRKFLPEEIEELEKHKWVVGPTVYDVKIEPIKRKWRNKNRKK